MKINAAVLTALFVVSLWSGCETRGPNVKGTTEESLVCDGITRNYYLYVPTRYNGLIPLVVVLHFGGGNATIIERVTEMTEKAEEEGFIVVYPDGTGRNNNLTWNAGFCCGYAVENNSDDITFVLTLIENLEKRFTIDPSRIYVTGFCNGAALTHKIGAELSSVVAAIAPVAGTIGQPDSLELLPENPVSVLVMNGVHDEYIPYEGGVTKSGVPVASAAESALFWVEHNECDTVEKKVSESGNIIIETYTGKHADVVLYTIVNGGHAWPGGRKFAGGDEPTQEVSATNVIWEFFKNHPKPELSFAHDMRTEFVDPAVTDPLITEYELPDAESIRHLVAVDTHRELPGVLYVHLPGSGGLPEDYQEITVCAALCGYHVVNLAYPNWPAVRVLIQGNTDAGLPECIRRERLYGEDCTDLVDVSRADSVENRLLQVIQYNHYKYPKEGWDTFVIEGHLRWDRIVVGGHSQGAGHAAYLAKEHNLAGIIMFAGPGDFVTGKGPAPWLYYENVTPSERMYAFTHSKDPVAKGFFANQRILGLDTFGSVQNVDVYNELTAHMLTSTLWTDSGNYHSCIILDECLSYTGGDPVYKPVWEYVFTSLIQGIGSLPFPLRKGKKGFIPNSYVT